MDNLWINLVRTDHLIKELMLRRSQKILELFGRGELDKSDIYGVSKKTWDFFGKDLVKIGVSI